MTDIKFDFRDKVILLTQEKPMWLPRLTHQP